MLLDLHVSQSYLKTFHSSLEHHHVQFTCGGMLLKLQLECESLIAKSLGKTSELDLILCLNSQIVESLHEVRNDNKAISLMVHVLDQIVQLTDRKILDVAAINDL